MPTPKAPYFRRRDRDPAVARSQVVDDVAGGHVRQLQHRVDDAVGRGDVAHIRLLRAFEGLRKPAGARQISARTPETKLARTQKDTRKRGEPSDNHVVRAREFRERTAMTAIESAG